MGEFPSVVLDDSEDDLTLALEPAGIRNDVELATLCVGVLFTVAMMILIAWGITDFVLDRPTEFFAGVGIMAPHLVLFQLCFVFLVYPLLNKALRKPIFTATNEELC